MTAFLPLPLEEHLTAIECDLLRSERIALALDGLSRLAQTDHNLQIAAALDVLSEALAASLTESHATIGQIRAMIGTGEKGGTVQ